ncbi:hypothetical protein SAMN06272775_5689 [Streptomyces sp. 2323.1]|nr:hypothetical protein SAMN06272775_5689 [Streptomyces sp. 2323.1]
MVVLNVIHDNPFDQFSYFRPLCATSHLSVGQVGDSVYHGCNIGKSCKLHKESETAVPNDGCLCARTEWELPLHLFPFLTVDHRRVLLS